MIDPAECAKHVEDAYGFELPFGLGHDFRLPEVFGLQLTKFMVIELIAAALMLVLFIPLARKVASGAPPRGWLWNMLEAMVLFVRDQMVRPAIGHHHEADRFVPFILTLFFFILFCNLLGLVPWLGSPTGAISVTAALALLSFVVVVGAGMKKYGPVGFILGLCPRMDLPLPLKMTMFVIMLPIEILGMLIKHTILAVRLLANMFAGHLVLAVILFFIQQFADSIAWYGVMPASVIGATALSLLELLVAFLQAYIFAFLTSLFIGMALHQH